MQTVSYMRRRHRRDVHYPREFHGTCQSRSSYSAPNHGINMLHVEAPDVVAVSPASGTPYRQIWYLFPHPVHALKSSHILECVMPCLCPRSCPDNHSLHPHHTLHPLQPISPQTPVRQLLQLSSQVLIMFWITHRFHQPLPRSELFREAILQQKICSIDFVVLVPDVRRGGGRG